MSAASRPSALGCWHRRWRLPFVALIGWAIASCLLPQPIVVARSEPTGERGGEQRGIRPAPQVDVARPSRSLRGGDGLARVYDLILDADFAAIEPELRRACGPAPPESCLVLNATALWWRIQLDPESRSVDEEFSASVERAIEATEEWTERAPDSAEAWFYLGGAYAARVQFRVLRNEKLSAARDGKRIKESLERALLLDPGLDDAYFGIGMYRYYAAVAPAAARFLRFLLLLPGGNREEGLEQMLRARSRGQILQGEADYQLHIVYLWYEQQTARALELLRDLQQQYPGNPLFLSQIAEIEDTYEHDPTASLSSWRTLLTQTLAGRINAAELTEVRTRLAIARHLDTLAETDEAVDHLERVVALKPAAPYSALALAYLRLGEAHDRLNARPDAMAMYRLASLSAPEGDRHNIRREAAERLRKTPNERHAEAYRLSLAGWRQLERKEVAAATATLSQSIALNERDPVARYRFARALISGREMAAARVQLETAITLGAKDPRLCPPPILGTIYLEAAQLYERAGERDRAIGTYRIASTLFGAADDTQRLAARAVARLSSR
jgi:tetratricopeptide (TPR) repeat protein